MAILKRIERGRFLDDFLETAPRGGGAVAANQKRDLADIGNIFEEIDKPDLADEPRDAYQHEVPVRQILAHRETLDPRRFPKESDRLARRNVRARGCLYGAFEPLRLLRPAKLSQ